MTDYEAKYQALRRLVLDNVDRYSDKVIHVFNGPDFQSWVFDLHIPDPLPENWDYSDTQKIRLTPEQALDRYIEAIISNREGAKS